MKSRSELRKSSEHLLYEVWMLRLAAREVVDHPSGSINGNPWPDDGSFPKPVAFTSHVEHTYDSGVPYTQPSREEESALFGNALLESFAIHLRALLDFFYPNPNARKKKDDVRAAHFFQKPENWIAVRPELPDDEVKSIKTRVSKEIAHLTYRRNEISQVDSTWPILELKPHILRALKVFLNEVDRSLLSDRWESSPVWRIRDAPD